MNTTDLPALIRGCVDDQARPVTVEEVKGRVRLAHSPLPAQRPVPAGRRRVRVGVAIAGVAGLAAAGVAGVLVSKAGGGSATTGTAAIGKAATGTVLTAATVRHLASASQTAMTSGQADIDWTSSGQHSVIQQISFNGSNWNDIMNPGQPAHVWHTAHGVARTGETINRVVGGRQYHYPAIVTTPKGLELTSGWMLFPASAAGQPLTIPDPRTLLSVLSPAARFVADGTATVNGVTLSQLRAATPGAVPVAPLNDIISSEPDGARLSAIDVWVDSSDVVLKAQVTVSGTNGSGARQSVTVTVTFSQVGQLQPIRPPASYTKLG
jgi:hypothetical protein